MSATGRTHGGTGLSALARMRGSAAAWAAPGSNSNANSTVLKIMNPPQSGGHLSQIWLIFCSPGLYARLRSKRATAGFAI